MAENDPLSGWRTFLQQLHARKIETVIIMDELGWESPQAALRGLATQPGLAAGQCLTFRPPGGADLVDVFLASATEVQELDADAETVEFLGTPLRIASLRRLRAMKTSTARPIDLADVAMIDEVLKG